MQITTRSRYATRAMLEIALEQEEGPLGLRTIAQRQEIPRKYLESLFKHLRSVGLVRSVRGAGGGYTLAREPEQITLWQIVKALEAKVSVAECINDSEYCHRSSLCVTRDVWQELERSMSRMLKSVSLADLVSRHREKQQRQALYYSI